MNTGVKFLFVVAIVILPLFSNAQGKFKIVKLKNPENYDVKIKLKDGRNVQAKDTLSKKEFDEFDEIVKEEFKRKNRRIGSCEVRDIENDIFKDYQPDSDKNKSKNTDPGVFPHKSDQSVVGWIFDKNPTADIINLYPEKRAAFLIGNSDYNESRGFPPLENVKNDIEGVGKRMKDLGFDVYKRYNVDLDTMIKAIVDFCYEKGQRYDFVLFYYAGHGKRFEDKDFIIPVNATDKPASYQDTIKDCCLDAIITAGKILTEKGTKLLIAIDACRKIYGIQKDICIEHETTPKFAGICLMQATLPSGTATDVKKSDYTPFADAFINICGSTGKSFEYELREIADSVELNSEQRPTIKNTIPRNCFFFFCKDSIPERMKAKYEKTFHEAKKHFENGKDFIARNHFETIPFSFNDSICTYLAVCNANLCCWDTAESLFKIADSAYNIKFLNEEYGKFLMKKNEHRKALNKLLINADTSRVEQESGFLFKTPDYYDSTNAIKDSIGILYELLAEEKTNDAYIDSAFIWFARSNSPYSRYRRLDLVNKKKISDSVISNKFFKYETSQYRQLKRIIKKYNDYDAKYYLGKFNIQNSKFTETSRMYRIGKKWLEEDWDVGKEEARELLKQERNPEDNGSQYTLDSNSWSYWSKWWNYTVEEWKFSDYWGVNFHYGNNVFDFAGHYRHKNISIGFGYGKFGIMEDDFFSETNKEERGDYICDNYVDNYIRGDLYDYHDQLTMKKPWMIYGEIGYNLKKIVTLSLGMGGFRLYSRLDFWYKIDNHIDVGCVKNANLVLKHKTKLLLYPQLHFHWLFTECYSSKWIPGLTIDVGYRGIIQFNEEIFTRKEILKQYNGFTCGVGLEYAF